jgi:hypothetical protein
LIEERDIAEAEIVSARKATPFWVAICVGGIRFEIPEKNMDMRISCPL